MNRWKRAAPVAVGCGLLSLSAAAIGAQGKRDSVADVVDEMRSAARADVTTSISDDTGFVTFISFDRPIAGALNHLAPAQERAEEFMARFGTAFGTAGREGLELLRVSAIDEVGMEHVRFRQMHRGIPVTGGEIVVHLNAGGVTSVNASVVAELDGLNGSPAVSQKQAAFIVERILANEMGVSDAKLSEPKLEFFNRGHLERRPSATRLAWFIEATGADLREFIWIDAIGGHNLLQFSQLTDAKNREVYDADDPGDGVYDTLPGNLVRAEGGAATGDTDADLAYDYAGDTYDYFFAEHGRDSYDGAGATIVSSVHFCPSATLCPFANAFWNGQQMVYGEGFSSADDVVAHELTHAVTEKTANLFYYMQSGALSESYSDIFGETVDLLNLGGTDDPSVRWHMGEDLPGAGAIRNLNDPTLFSHPGKMSDPEFVCTPALDQGGVHSNNGVPNHAYALMVDGGSYNGFTVTGVGLTKAAKIHYRALSRYLTSASDFLDNYNALKQSCEDLVGTSGITVADCTEVSEALDAVEMAATWPCTLPTNAGAVAHCPVDQAPVILSYQDFSSGGGLLACSEDTLPTDWCANGVSSVLGPFATSGTDSAWGYSSATGVTIDMDFSEVGDLPANARLQFDHSFGFAARPPIIYWDGGVIEYSSGGGAWTDAGSLITDGQAYGGILDNSSGNPLGGRSAFVGNSWGYTTSQLDLSSLAGQTLSYRFSFGTALGGEYGWFVDDIRTYVCFACRLDRSLTQAHTGTASNYRASNSIVAGSGFTVRWIDSVVLDAGNLIELENGFSVENGGALIVKLDGCP